MTHPPANDHRSDEDRRNSVTSERPGLEEMIAEADALRAQLAEAVQRATRLLVALRQQRRHRRVLQTTIDSLREWKLGP